MRFRQDRLALLGLAILITISIVVLFGPFFIPEEAAFFTDTKILGQPPSVNHILGTDHVGRDIAARIVYAGRISLFVGLSAALISVLLGTTFGALAGYYGGWADTVVMRSTDVLLSIPQILSIIILATFMDRSVRTIILVIGILSWMEIARLVRANVLVMKEMEFIGASYAIGCGASRVIFRHIIPNTVGIVIVAVTLGVGNAILMETALSYLGLGVQPPVPSWGNMLFNAQIAIWRAPWIAVFPGLMIMITVLSVHLVGEGLRDAFDPRTLIKGGK
jgi:peptide/nickel transport system permease protein